MFISLFLCLNLFRFIIFIFLIIKLIILVTLLWIIILLIFIWLYYLFCLSLRFLSRKRRTSNINRCLIIILIFWNLQFFIWSANQWCYIGINIFNVIIIIIFFNIMSLIFILEINFIGNPCLCKNFCIWKETCIIIARQSCLVLKICLYRIKFLSIFMNYASIFLFRWNSIYLNKIWKILKLLTLIGFFFIN